VKRGKKPDAKVSLKRRHLLKLMGTLPAGALLSFDPRVWAAQRASAGPPASPEVSKAYQPKVLTPHEWKTVRVLCDLIIPTDEVSGSATAAGVPEFIDDWLDFKRGNLLDEIRGGLTWLDIESNRSFRYDFADCTASQQKQILDRIAYPAKAAPEDASAVVFFNHFRDLAVSGFFTSEMGIRDLPYLGNEPQSEWQGCPATVLAELGLAAKSTKS
jgi:Gluconate 2-dehydrogenase subunit 3